MNERLCDCKKRVELTSMHARATRTGTSGPGRTVDIIQLEGRPMHAHLHTHLTTVTVPIFSCAD